MSKQITNKRVIKTVMEVRRNTDVQPVTHKKQSKIRQLTSK